MSNQKNTIDKAYGNMPKEIPGIINMFDFIPLQRPFKYFWLNWIVRNFR